MDNIGLTPETFNYAFGDGATISSADGEVLIALNAKHHGPTEKYMRQMRSQLQKQFPDLTFFFQPADMVTQILNFGLPRRSTYRCKAMTPATMRLAPACASAWLRFREPSTSTCTRSSTHLIFISISTGFELRSWADPAGLGKQSLYLTELQRCGAAEFWLDPKMGITYTVAAQTPQYNIDSINALQNTPIPIHTLSNRTEVLGNMATLSPAIMPVVINHHNGAPVFDIYANTQDDDLGSVAAKINRIVKEESKTLPPGTKIVVRGQVESMNEAFTGLV